MTELKETITGRKRFAFVLSGTLLVLAGLVTYFGVQDSWAIASRPSERTWGAATFDEVELPPGPHRTEFQTSCVTCHSARLVLGQPTLPREKWAEVVHKMVAVYGAALTPTDEANVVEYMSAVQGDR